MDEQYGTPITSEIAEEFKELLFQQCDIASALQALGTNPHWTADALRAIAAFEWGDAPTTIHLCTRAWSNCLDDHVEGERIELQRRFALLVTTLRSSVFFGVCDGFDDETYDLFDQLAASGEWRDRRLWGQAQLVRGQQHLIQGRHSEARDVHQEALGQDAVGRFSGYVGTACADLNSGEHESGLRLLESAGFDLLTERFLLKRISGALLLAEFYERLDLPGVALEWREFAQNTDAPIRYVKAATDRLAAWGELRMSSEMLVSCAV